MTAPIDPAKLPKIVATIGVRSSASTWLFNIAKDLVIAAVGTENMISGYAETCGPIFEVPSTDATRIVLKSHKIDAELEKLLADWNAPIFLSVRDPRDAMVSWMQRFNTDFEHALIDLSWDTALMLKLGAAGHMVFRYEDRFFEDRAVPKAVAQRLRLNLTDEQSDILVARYRSERIKAFTQRIPSLPADRIIHDTLSVKDGVTQFHVNHIGDGRTGKWRTFLTSEQAKSANELFRPFLERFGYEAA